MSQIASDSSASSVPGFITRRLSASYMTMLAKTAEIAKGVLPNPSRSPTATASPTTSAE